MGREDRRKRDRQTPAVCITLEPGDYWKLKALMSDLRAAREKATQLVTHASAAHDAHAKALAEKYSDFILDNGQYRLDDETCTLIRQP